jgi:UDP-3-O-[3-hydroxymyristoyl] N-acetylglucosamine deacetylase
VGSFSAHKSGHCLNNRLLQGLAAQPEVWELVSFEDEQSAPISFTRPAVSH